MLLHARLIRWRRRSVLKLRIKKTKGGISISALASAATTSTLMSFWGGHSPSYTAYCNENDSDTCKWKLKKKGRLMLKLEKPFFPCQRQRNKFQFPLLTFMYFWQLVIISSSRWASFRWKSMQGSHKGSHKMIFLFSFDKEKRKFSRHEHGNDVW